MCALQTLAAVFADLRDMADDGRLPYPYSTRELVNVARHIEAHPGEPLPVVLENVFSFDSYDAELRVLLGEVFRKHGIELGGGTGGV